MKGKQLRYVIAAENAQKELSLVSLIMRMKYKTKICKMYKSLNGRINVLLRNETVFMIDMFYLLYI